MNSMDATTGIAAGVGAVTGGGLTGIVMRVLLMRVFTDRDNQIHAMQDEMKRMNDKLDTALSALSSHQLEVANSYVRQGDCHSCRNACEARVAKEYDRVYKMLESLGHKIDKLNERVEIRIDKNGGEFKQ